MLPDNRSFIPFRETTVIFEIDRELTMRTTLAKVIRRDSALVLLLSWAAGSIDAISYVTAHVLPANMTGNTVLLGLDLGLGHQAEAIKSVIALGGYILVVKLGILLVESWSSPSIGSQPSHSWRGGCGGHRACRIFDCVLEPGDTRPKRRRVAGRAGGSSDGNPECNGEEAELAGSRDDLYHRYDHITDVGVCAGHSGVAWEPIAERTRPRQKRLGESLSDPGGCLYCVWSLNCRGPGTIGHFPVAAVSTGHRRLVRIRAPSRSRNQMAVQNENAGCGA